MFGGRRRGPLGGRPLGAGPGPRGRMLFDHALAQLEAGHYAEAATALDGLAQRGETHGVPPQRLAQVLSQAARAHLGAGRPNEAVARVKRAVALFVQAGRPGRAVQVAQRALAELRTHGYTAEATALEQTLNAQLAQAGLALNAAPATPTPTATLPARCTGCGAPLRPDEVEWHDARTAECPYCGSIAQATHA